MAKFKTKQQIENCLVSEFKIIGFTNSVNECDCCGKIRLKGTYCIEIDGNEFYYGSTCASKNINISSDEIKKEIKKIELYKNIDNLVNEAKTEFLQNKVFKLALKKGINKTDFLLKYGNVIDFLCNSKCYQYGSYNSYINF